MADNSKSPAQDKAESRQDSGPGEQQPAGTDGAGNGADSAGKNADLSSDKSPDKSSDKSPDKSPDNSPDKTAGKSAAVTGPKGASRGRSAVVVDIFFNLILLGCIGFIGFLVYEQDRSIDELFEEQTSFSSQRNAANARIEELQASLGDYDEAIAAVREDNARRVREQEQAMADLQSEIDRLQNELVSTRLRITQSNPGASQEWLLAEAASLLRLAQQHLVVARSVRTAQALYIAADEILKQVDDPAIFSVREILAGELASLRAVEEVDRQEIYLQLGGIAEQVATLQVNNDLAVQLAEGERLDLSPGAPDEEPGWFSGLLASIRNTLDNYLVVRRRDVPVQPLMTPGQESALMQVIQLQIEQARTALLKEEQEIYTASLRRARDNVERFLGGNVSARNAVLDTLDTLQRRRIVTEPPPLSRARSALEQILSASRSQ